MILNELYKLTELSPDTLSSYKKAAGADATAADAAGDYARGNKRFKGIVRATKKQFANDTKGVAEGSNSKVSVTLNGQPIGHIERDTVADDDGVIGYVGVVYDGTARPYTLHGYEDRNELKHAIADVYRNRVAKKGVAENFADGRNPQDKGDAKRHGVPTKASVSTLRKVAKQGGRKGQLAHWMANMKAGRAKNEDVAEAAHTANFNDDDWYEINPDTKTIVSQQGPQAYQVPFGQRQINLPNGNIVVRGMRAKGMGLDTGLDKPQQKEDGTWGAL